MRAYAYWAKVSQNGPEPSPEIERPGAARFQLRGDGSRVHPLVGRNPKPSLRLVQPDAFYLNSQQHVLLESILLAVIHAEIRAVEGARSIGAAHFLLEHGMIKAFK